MFTKKYFADTIDGTPVYLFEVRNSHGIKIEILSYGGIVRALQVPDSKGATTDIVLGYDRLENYEKQDKYFGAIIGRCANRIGGSCFAIDGKTYQLHSNEGKNQLHGGLVGFDKKIWMDRIDDDKLHLSYISADGEEGYPGELRTTVTYSLTEANEFCIDYEAVSNQDTVVNLTNHSYFNLNGHDSGSVRGHLLKIHSMFITPVKGDMIALGSNMPIEGSPFDFQKFFRIGNRIDDSHEQLHIGGGYDHNYIINGTGMRLAVELIGDKSNIKMDVYTDMDGMQLYTGNFIEGAPLGKGEISYQNQSAVCLETQFFPNAINCPGFPSPVLRAGEIYRHRTVYQFKTI